MKLKYILFSGLLIVSFMLYLSCDEYSSGAQSSASSEVYHITVGDAEYTYKIIDGHVIINGDMAVAEEGDSEEVIREGILRLYPQEEHKGIITTDSLKWSDGIVYYAFDSEYPENDKEYVLDAISWWDKAAPGLRFIKRTNQRNYVYFKEIDGNISWSYVGMIGGKQEISIASLTNTGVIAHEIGHAIGLRHVHQRSDRNQYVTVYEQNIKWDYTLDFTVHSSATDYGNEYDYDSIMHYYARAFGRYCSVYSGIPIGGGPSVEYCDSWEVDDDGNVINEGSCTPKHCSIQWGGTGRLLTIEAPEGVAIGQSDHLSEIDKKKARYLYPLQVYDTPCDIPGLDVTCCF